MAVTSHGPAVPRRRLGAELRRLRDGAGLTLEQAARELDCSTSKISRLETGKGLPKLRDVRDLARLYGKEAEGELELLLRWAREGAKTGWWQEYTKVLDHEPFMLSGADRIVALESDATRIKAFEQSCVHGLLQTADYAEVILRSVLPHHADDEIALLVELRMRRQEVLAEHDSPLHLHVVLDESALRRLVGESDVMTNQVERLLEVAGWPNVLIQMLPFGAGFTRASAGSFAVIEFAESVDQDVVYVESHAGAAYLEGDFGVETYARIFDDVTRQALGPVETEQWLRRLLT